MHKFNVVYIRKDKFLLHRLMGKELVSGEAMVSSLKTLYRESSGNLTPHPFVVKREYTRPPLDARIRAIE